MNTAEINKLGKELELFTYADYIGKGFPIFLPKGAKLINLIRNYVESEEAKYGYEVVRTPNVSKAEIYKIEDRFDLYKDQMFIIKSNDNEENWLVLRPYASPFHCTIYKNKQRSYKNLPIKLSETSTVYRNEKDIKGISKTRQITLSDASIFVAQEDLEKEIKEALQIQQNFIAKLGLDVNYFVSSWNTSKREEYIGQIEEWEYTTNAMKNALNSLNIPYVENNKALMYGPSIQIMYNKKEFSSIQVDFEIVHRFDVTYVNKDDEEQYPVYIYRTSVGSYENLLSILLEKYEGDFPLWIAPIQAVIIPEDDEYNNYAQEILQKMLSSGIRATIDATDTNTQNKEYRAFEQCIPYTIKIGKTEFDNNKIKVRSKTYIDKIMETDNLVQELLKKID